MRFAKGHGTGNDFVILPDPDGRLDLTPALAARLCDRHAGLGADGVLRAVRPAAAGADGAEAAEAGAGWFMDYRNADGSIAEMCGNGLRVFARYLLDEGLADGPDLLIGTRAGLRTVTGAGSSQAEARASSQADGAGTADPADDRRDWLTAAWARPPSPAPGPP